MSEMFALVLNHKETPILQQTNKIRIKPSMGQRQPERLIVIGKHTQPAIHIRVRINQLGTLEFLALSVRLLAIKLRYTVRPEEVFAELVIAIIELDKGQIILVQILIKNKTVLQIKLKRVLMLLEPKHLLIG